MIQKCAVRCLPRVPRAPVRSSSWELQVNPRRIASQTARQETNPASKSRETDTNSRKGPKIRLVHEFARTFTSFPPGDSQDRQTVWERMRGTSFFLSPRSENRAWRHSTHEPMRVLHFGTIIKQQSLSSKTTFFCFVYKIIHLRFINDVLGLLRSGTALWPSLIKV